MSRHSVPSCSPLLSHISQAMGRQKVPLSKLRPIFTLKLPHPSTKVRRWTEKGGRKSTNSCPQKLL